jgi:hypothetical protein
MHDAFVFDPFWWISVVELPALAGLFVLFWRQRRETESKIETTGQHQMAEIAHLRDSLGDHRLEVAKSYASIAYLQEFERRITRHLIRIENKLDASSASNGGGVA